MTSEPREYDGTCKHCGELHDCLLDTDGNWTCCGCFNGHTDRLRGDLKRSRARVAELQQQLDDTILHVTGLEAQIASLEQSATKAEQQLDEARAFNGETLKRIASLRAEIARVRGERDRWHHKFDMIHDDNRRLEAKRLAAWNRVDTLQQQLDDSGLHVTGLEAQIASLEQSATKAEQQLADRDRLKATVERVIGIILDSKRWTALMHEKNQEAVTEILAICRAALADPTPPKGGDE